MKVKCGSLISSISGKLSNSFFQTGNSGTVLRKIGYKQKPILSTPNPQSINFAFIVKAWRTLPELARAEWNDFNYKFNSGFAWFTSVNLFRLANNLPLQQFPYASGSSPLFPNPLAYWPFNGNANDEQSGTYNGTPINSAYLTTGRNGSPDSAFAFYLTGAITLGNVLNFGLNSFSISVWVKIKGTIWGGYFIMSKQESVPPYNGFWLYQYNGVIYLVLYSNYVSKTISGSAILEIGVYSNIFIECDRVNKTVSIFVDNQPYVTNYDISDLTGSLSNIADFLFAAFGSYSGIDGALDDIRIWDKLLTSSERTAVFNDDN